MQVVCTSFYELLTKNMELKEEAACSNFLTDYATGLFLYPPEHIRKYLIYLCRQGV